MAAIMNSLPVEFKPLYLPPLPEVAQVLENGLKKNFREVKVGVVDCPNLTEEPWHLAAPGLCGSPRLLDIGGVPYLMPFPNKDKLYDLGEMASIAGHKNGFIFGAGAGSHLIAGCNCEMMPNAKISEDPTNHKNCSYIAKLDEYGREVCERFYSLEAGLMANVMVCEGVAGPVLEVTAKHRKGEDNFVSCMRKAMAKKYGDKPVALGGVFLIEKGQVKVHIMPDEFSETPLISREEMEKWLKFYDKPAPLICLSEFVSHDPGLDLRIEHTHCFSTHNAGGHYHNDVTPDEVEYHGYYTIAEQLVRIDQPSIAYQFGRDCTS